MSDASTPWGTIDLRGLVDAYFEHHAYQDARDSEFKDYAVQRLELLERAFNASFLDKLTRARDPFLPRHRTPGMDRDRYQAIELARTSLKRCSTLYSPFGAYMEGRPGPIEQNLSDRHGDDLRQLNRKLRERYYALFADCLLVFYPAAVDVRTTEKWLSEQGLPERPESLF